MPAAGRRRSPLYILYIVYVYIHRVACRGTFLSLFSGGDTMGGPNALVVMAEVEVFG